MGLLYLLPLTNNVRHYPSSEHLYIYLTYWLRLNCGRMSVRIFGHEVCGVLDAEGEGTTNLRNVENYSTDYTKSHYTKI